MNRSPICELCFPANSPWSMASSAWKATGRFKDWPKHAGVLVAGRDMAAVDATCCRIMRIDPSKVAYLRLAAEAGGQIAEHEIHQLDERIAAVATPFALCRIFIAIAWAQDRK